MRSFREIAMLRASTLAVLVTAAVLTGGCDMNTTNPNAPDTKRAFGTPEGLTQLMAGAIQNWVGTRDNYQVMPLTAMADNYTASWNNAAIRFYSSVGSDCASRCGWTNSATAPEAAGGPTVEAQWYGYYSVLNAGTLIITRIKAGLCFDDDCTTADTNTVRALTIATMLQGFALAGIANMYDQGFILDENTDLTDPTALAFSTRAQVRDAALQKLDSAYVLAGSRTWKTEPEWMGAGQGQEYTNIQIQQVIRTAEAELLAMFPRSAAENAAVDWARVVTYASQGVSSGTPFHWDYYVDINNRECGLECVKNWGNSIGTMRVDTRIAKMLDPLTQEDPWTGAPGTVKNPNTRVTTAIVGSPVAQAVTPLSMNGIIVGRTIEIGCPNILPCKNGEYVTVTAVTPTQFTGVVAKNHPAPTTLSAAVTADTVPVTATPAIMAGIDTGSYLMIDSTENVTVRTITATTFTALFKKDHASGASVAEAMHRNSGSNGNPCPFASLDKRVGDGSYGPKDNFNGYSTRTKTANAGTDYACSAVAIFPAARGQYHQSNMQHVRYHALASRGEDLPTDDGTGQDPMFTEQMNDLLWAEGLIRSSQNPALAATLINNSRVGRGGLAPIAAGDADTVKLDALHYEQEIEFMGQGATAFFNRRRVDGLILNTPRHMPVPAKELDILQRAIYTFGGGSSPDMAPPIGGAARRETVEDRYRALQALRPHGSFLSGTLY
ncbi:MAG TPA: hypothetical protein VEK83_06235 [Gemmatimonadales bacterium]|nr:hypothetical protein [Gemmatimonadales bacterium]